jgi:copper chaperone CopZ
MQSIIKIGGMSCQGCVSSVEGALKKMPGVESVKVELKEGRAVIGHDGAKVSAADLAAKITDIGYDAQVTSG